MVSACPKSRLQAGTLASRRWFRPNTNPVTQHRPTAKRVPGPVRESDTRLLWPRSEAATLSVAPRHFRSDPRQNAGGVPASAQTLPDLGAVRGSAAGAPRPGGELRVPGTSRQPEGGAAPPGAHPQDPQPGEFASTRPGQLFWNLSLIAQAKL